VRATACAFRLGSLLACALISTWLFGCSSYRASGGEGIDSYNIGRAEDAVRKFKQKDPTLQKFFDKAIGYAVFPSVTKGGLVIGASHGAGGVVFEQARAIGFSEVTQVTVGAQIGGQGFSELVFFENKAILDDFKRGNLEFAANASAVAATAGAGATSDFANGVAVFTLGYGGLMLEAAIGGQKFSYRPASTGTSTARAPTGE